MVFLDLDVVFSLDLDFRFLLGLGLVFRGSGLGFSSESDRISFVGLDVSKVHPGALSCKAFLLGKLRFGRRLGFTLKVPPGWFFSQNTMGCISTK